MKGMRHSFFDSVSEAPADPIFHLTAAFQEDERPFKVNLSVGLYRDEALQTPVLKSVKTAEKYLLSQEKTKEYLPISGDPLYIEESGRLIFGDVLWNEHRSTICGMQTPGGTGGLRVGGELLKQVVGDGIAIPEPTWPNHVGVFKQCGYKIDFYRYYNTQHNRLEKELLFETLRSLPARSIVLFHACCHNPTGADLSEQEWNDIADLFKKKQLLPFFDFAYQGFGKGIEKDAYAIRLFAQKSIECLVASSYSKNFGLYSERAGTIFAITHHEKSARHILSQLKIIARTIYSNPPRHGAAIVGYILSKPELKLEWMKEVDTMRNRLEKLRRQFVTHLQAGQKKYDFSYLLERFGMFCFLGLGKEQVLKLREDSGIYMTSDGRINLAGLSEQNINYVTESILKIV